MIRAYSVADLAVTAAVWYRSGKDEYSYLPDFQALTPGKAKEVFKEMIAGPCDIWVDEDDGTIRGFLAMKASYIDRLYVDPAQQRSGVGEGLMAFAKSLQPDGLELHTHQQNQRARAFYEKHGFKAIRFGVSAPPESVPDVEYHWRPEKQK